MPSPPLPGGSPGAKQPHLAEGPRWLYNLVFHTPGWLSLLLAFAAVISVALAVRGVRSRGWTVYRDDQLEMLTTAWTVVVIMMTTAAAVNILDAGYTTNVITGILLGVCVSQGSLWFTSQHRVTHTLHALGMSVSERLAAAWLATGTVGFLGVNIAATQGKGTLLLRMRAILLVIAAAFVVYDLHQDDTEIVRPDTERGTSD